MTAKRKLPSKLNGKAVHVRHEGRYTACTPTLTSKTHPGEMLGILKNAL
jgi:hypothetical protein